MACYVLSGVWVRIEIDLRPLKAPMDEQSGVALVFGRNPRETVVGSSYRSCGGSVESKGIGYLE